MYRIIFVLAMSLGIVACSNNDKKISDWEVNDVYHSTIITPNPSNNTKSYQGPPINSMDEANTYQMFSIRGERNSQGTKTFEILAQLTYFSQWRYYDAASLKGKPLPDDIVAFGEVGLLGEVRATSYPLKRIKEAQALGFRTILLPKSDFERVDFKEKGITLKPVSSLKEAFQLFFG